MQKDKRDSDEIRQQMQRAKNFIDSGKYDEARRILITVDHPKADEWLNRLNQMSLNQPQTVVIREEKKRPGCARQLVNFVGALFLCGILASIFAAYGNNSGSNPPRNNNNSSNASSSSASLGSRSAPFPAGSTQAVQDGRLRVNSIRTDATSAVMEMNMFNSDPDAGEEWVLVNITFYCDLGADDDCSTTLMQFDLVGDSGEAYDHELFAVLDDKFEGDVLGGGSKTGNVGFIVSSSDSNLLFAVNEFGRRKFFDIPGGP